MRADNQPSDASGAATLFGKLPSGVPGAGAACTGNNTQAGTAAQVPNTTDASEPTNHFVDVANMGLYHAQALEAHHAAMLTENASMETGAGHQAGNFELIAHPINFDYIPESNSFELSESNHFHLPHSNDLDLPHPNISDLPHPNISDLPPPESFLWLLDYNGDDEPIVDDKDYKLPDLDELERALLEGLEELPEDADSAFPAQQPLDEQPQQLLQPNVQQWQPQPNEEQQQPQQKLDKTLKLANDLFQLLETRHTVSPAQLEESINQLLGSQQSASPAPFQENSTQLLEPQQSASPAQFQESALPAMAQSTQQQQQQQQSRASLFPQRLPDLDAMLEKISIITDNFKEVHARTCECVDGVNMRVAQGSSRDQELATFQVDNQVHRWVNHWVKEDAKNPWAPILRDTPPVPSAIANANANANANFNLYEFLNSYNRSFSWLYWRAMSASSGLKRILQGLPHDWIFGKGPDAVAEELRQAVIECHTLSLNTFNALLAFMEHDNNLLPHRFTDNWNFDVLSTINQTQGNQTQGQGPNPSDAIRYLTEKCHERILAQSRYVHSLLRDLYPYPVLPDLQQVQAITEDQLQMLRQQQKEAARDYPMLSVCPFAAGPNTNNDQIKTLEFCVFYRLNFILQRLPRM
ncbi:hypothetical protein A0O28_0016500 [Trichoderma guizhouense]|uniref:Uncharacterized protein n=1 Tax=Trichoderma guizhouense TaxID=1491466 RepID=A0A1T3CBT3_9HYPO|nr:hypothetical protein A0O28_0016500 [Trichoderma guizhouense]